jgi:hypothetical protein
MERPSKTHTLATVAAVAQSIGDALENECEPTIAGLNGLIGLLDDLIISFNVRRGDPLKLTGAQAQFELESCVSLHNFLGRGPIKSESFGGRSINCAGKQANTRG